MSRITLPVAKPELCQAQTLALHLHDNAHATRGADPAHWHRPI